MGTSEENKKRQLKWDIRFLKLAKFWALECSLDPSTKVGAVIADSRRGIVSLGYNGFPIGVIDTHERLHNRDLKYPRVQHAEQNAFAFAKTHDFNDCTIYTWPFPPCSSCAGSIIQRNIKRVVAPEMSDELRQRWGDSIAVTLEMFAEAGVTIEYADLE